MPFFYTDSGSFNNLEVTGSTILSGSLIVSGATNFGPSGLTGSLFGSASYADSASFATTASFALNGGGASTPAFPFSGSAVITGSLLVSGGSVPLTVGGDIPIFQVNQGTNTVSVNNPATASLSYLEIQSSTNRGYIQIAGGPVLDGFAIGSSPSQKSLTIRQAGTVDIVDTDLFRVKGTVTASAYTSSLNNQVGYFGTSSFAVSSSQAISASFAQTAVTASYFSGSVNFPDGLTVSSMAVTNGLTVDTDGLVVNATTDRVGIGTSVPTARLTVNGNTDVSGSITATGGTHFFGKNIGGSEVGLTLGDGRTANGFAYIDLVGDTTYTDYGLRIIRDNTGANAPTKFLHRGTGNIEYYSSEPADIVWITDNATRMTVKGLGGFVGLNKTNPTARLDILGDQIISGSLIVSASTGTQALTITGSINLSGAVTASAGISQFSPATVRLTVGTTAPSSPAVNDLWVDTN